MASERQSRIEIVHLGKLMHTSGFVAGMDGNLSVRLDADRLLVTPTAMSKGAMRTTDLVVVDLDGRKLQGRRNVSSEIGMHLLIYKLRPDIRAIVHAHPPTATGFAASGMDLSEPLVCELVVGLGCVPLARYGTPGTRELADALAPLIPDYDAILMANHGVVAYADDLQHAYMKMETVEHFAKVALVAHLLGRQQPLSESDVEKLLSARKQYEGARSRAPMPPSPRNGKSPLRSELEKESLPELASPERR
ncbi:MAG TPA: class II aldolase/adducin family protein [Terriglobales bacterium]|nr:class II aldolase/adducin family protein [Terriglobales bacterium]